MNNTKYVHFNSLDNGGLYLHGQSLIHAPNTAILWDDFISALVKFGIPSIRGPVNPPRHPAQPSIGELEEQFGGTVEFAIFELYQRRFVGSSVGRQSVGCIVKTKHSHGTSIVVMKPTTAAFAKSHRNFTRHTEYGFIGDANYNQVGMAFLSRLTSAVKGLDLQENEYRFLIEYYQNLLATI